MLARRHAGRQSALRPRNCRRYAASSSARRAPLDSPSNEGRNRKRASTLRAINGISSWAILISKPECRQQPSDVAVAANSGLRAPRPGSRWSTGRHSRVFDTCEGRCAKLPALARMGVKSGPLRSNGSFPTRKMSASRRRSFLQIEQHLTPSAAAVCQLLGIGAGPALETRPAPAAAAGVSTSGFRSADRYSSHPVRAGAGMNWRCDTPDQSMHPVRARPRRRSQRITARWCSKWPIRFDRNFRRDAPMPTNSPLRTTGDRAAMLARLMTASCDGVESRNPPLLGWNPPKLVALFHGGGLPRSNMVHWVPRLQWK